MPVIGRPPISVFFAIALLETLGACATAPARLNLFPGDAHSAREQTWPSAPEVPRYRFAGVLTGEANFPPAPKAQASRGMRFLRWITGAEERTPRERTLLRPQCGLVDKTGRILITDVGRQAVFVFDPRGAGLSIWDRADKQMQFATPLGIAQGPHDEVWVSDADLARVVRLDVNGNPLGSFGEGVLRRPTGLARDATAGITYVVDTSAHDIKVFDDKRALVRTIGQRGVRLGEFNAPTFLTFGKDGLVVSDTLNARVQLVSPLGEGLAAIGERGLYVGNLTRPKGVAVDGDGNIYVVESFYDHLLVFDRAGALLLPIGGGGTGPGKFFLPGGVWADRDNRIFVADVFNGRVVIFQYLGASP